MCKSEVLGREKKERKELCSTICSNYKTSTLWGAKSSLEFHVRNRKGHQKYSVYFHQILHLRKPSSKHVRPRKGKDSRKEVREQVVQGRTAGIQLRLLSLAKDNLNSNHIEHQLR